MLIEQTVSRYLYHPLTVHLLPTPVAILLATSLPVATIVTAQTPGEMTGTDTTPGEMTVTPDETTGGIEMTLVAMIAIGMNHLDEMIETETEIATATVVIATETVITAKVLPVCICC